MYTIKGGIKFEQGKELPLKLKDHIKKDGVNLPFVADKFEYSNKELDDWLVIKKDGITKKYNRISGNWEA